MLELYQLALTGIVARSPVSLPQEKNDFNFTRTQGPHVTELQDAFIKIESIYLIYSIQEGRVILERALVTESEGIEEIGD
jgi:hypothetical protein